MKLVQIKLTTFWYIADRTQSIHIVAHVDKSTGESIFFLIIKILFHASKGTQPYLGILEKNCAFRKRWFSKKIIRDIKGY